MINIPEILENPDNPLFNLEEEEIYLIKQTNELIELEKYPYVLFTLWSCIVLNIQRRIEKFGIKNLIDILKNKDEYNFQASSLKERWLGINEYDLIEYARKVDIIDHITHDLITSLYWMKAETNKENFSISKDELFSLLFLIEKNLFEKEFKKDKRKEENNQDRREIKRGGRRKGDKNDASELLSTTHQKLKLQSETKVYGNNVKDIEKNTNLLNTYI